MSTITANVGRGVSGSPTPRTIAVAGAEFAVEAAPPAAGAGSTTMPPKPAQLTHGGRLVGGSTCSHGPSVSPATPTFRCVAESTTGTPLPVDAAACPAEFSNATCADGPPTHGSGPVAGTTAMDAPGYLAASAASRRLRMAAAPSAPGPRWISSAVTRAT